MNFTPEQKRRLIGEQLKLVAFGVSFVVPVGILLASVYISCKIGMTLCSTLSGTLSLQLIYIFGVVWMIILVLLQRRTLHHEIDISQLRQKNLIPKRVSLFLILAGPVSVLLLTIRNILILLRMLALPLTEKVSKMLDDHPGNTANLSGIDNSSKSPINHNKWEE